MNNVLNGMAFAVATLALGTTNASANDWSGAYGGVELGFSQTDAGSAYPTAPFLDTPLEPGGPLLGFFLGQNWQQPNGFVYGFEVDLALSKIEDEGPLLSGGVPCCENWIQNIKAMTSLRGRAGFANGNWLFYGAAGLTAASVEGEVQNGPLGGPFVSRGTASAALTGYNVGLGVERMLNDNAMVRGEVRYYDLSGKAASYSGTIPTEFKDVSGVQIRLGIGLKF